MLDKMLTVLTLPWALVTLVVERVVGDVFDNDFARMQLDQLDEWEN